MTPSVRLSHQGPLRGHVSGMDHTALHPLVHLELQTENLGRACALYAELFRWKFETIRLRPGSYTVFELGDRLDGGVVEHPGGPAAWLPYFEVPNIATAVERGRALGAAVVLPPREGPAGWRAVLSTAAGGEIALWQSKT